MTDLRADLDRVSDLLRNAALRATSPNDALVLARLFARLHWDNISGHFSDEPFEAAMFDRWIATVVGAADGLEPLLPQVDFLHIATQIFDGGGHSRLLRQLVAGLPPDSSQGLFLTDKLATSTQGLPDLKAFAKGRPLRRAAAVVAAGRRAGTVLLHIHPDDSAAALAARILKDEGVKVLFVNHADHVFSLGPGAADIVLDICVTGWRTTRDRRAARAQSFMGIPVVSASQKVTEHVAPRDGPIVSMGGPAKFQPFGDLSFPDFLNELLPLVPNDAILIGPSEKDPWWAEVRAAFPGRIDLRGTQPQAEVAKILQTASCYVDSFPLDGGTAFPQSVFQGPPRVWSECAKRGGRDPD